jgi:hypothetical protein
LAFPAADAPGPLPYPAQFLTLESLEAAQSALLNVYAWADLRTKARYNQTGQQARDQKTPSHQAPRNQARTRRPRTLSSTLELAWNPDL